MSEMERPYCQAAVEWDFGTMMSDLACELHEGHQGYHESIMHQVEKLPHVEKKIRITVHWEER